MQKGRCGWCRTDLICSARNVPHNIGDEHEDIMPQHLAGKAPLAKWPEMARASKLPVFPIRIEWNGTKWEKKPLVKNWQNSRAFDENDYDWSGANGFGIVMGDPYYTLDIDGYKPGCEGEEWMRRHNVPTETRVHRTVSGGAHILYRLPVKWLNLRTRANVVPGLDTRGAGGFIAFGEGYEVKRRAAIARLPEHVCAILDAGPKKPGVSVSNERVAVEGYRPPEPKDGERRLQRAISMGPKLLSTRWGGGTSGLKDTSRSALDHSVARLLAMMDLDEDLIVWAILERFEHGAARWKPNAHTAVRAAVRSALKGRDETRAEIEIMRSFTVPDELTPEQEEAMRKALSK